MQKISKTWLSEHFAPDPKLKGNSLNDTFFQSLNLQDMTFDEGMIFVQNLFKSVKNCNSQFCQCVKKIRQFLSDNNYEIYFEDRNLPGVKSIIQSLDKEFEQKRYSFNELANYTGFGGKNNLTTLGKFAYLIEYTSFRGVEYSNFDSCFALKETSKVIYL